MITVPKPPRTATSAPMPLAQNPSILPSAKACAAVRPKLVVVPTAPGSVAPTGTVTFYSGSTALGTVAINSQGQATLPVTFKKAGTYKITVKYSGDANFAASTSAAFQETVS